MNDINNLVYKMLTENTGTNFLDSGGDNGRHWQRNQLKSIDDFENESQISYELSDGDELELNDIYPSVSLYHYMTMALELDEITNDFNGQFNVMADYESDWNFISKDAENWLVDNEFELHGDKENTYNYDNYFSQDVVYTVLKRGDNYYYLVSIHNGADARGGYTDAKLFKLRNNIEFVFSYLNITGTVNEVPVTNQYHGFSLSVDNDCEIDGATSELDTENFRFNQNANIQLDYWL